MIVLTFLFQDQNYSLLLLLPTPGLGINYVINSLTNWPLRKIYNYLRKTPVFAAIPKFSIISHVNLRFALYTVSISGLIFSVLTAYTYNANNDK